MIATQELQQEWMTEPALEAPTDRDGTIRSLLYLVQHIAGRLVAKLPSHVAKEDLISAGVVGLIDAVDRYDASKGCSLKTYSSLRIRGAMVDELRNQDWVPRTVHRDEKIYEQAAEKLGQKFGREATPEEIRIELGMTPQAFEQFSERTQSQRASRSTNHARTKTATRSTAGRSCRTSRRRRLSMKCCAKKTGPCCGKSWIACRRTRNWCCASTTWRTSA